jgi:biopolymer transport protein ExbB
MIETIVHFFVQGGIFMIPLVLCSIVSIAFIIERGIALKREKVLPKNIIKVINDYKIGDDPYLLAQKIKTQNTALERLVYVILEHLVWTKAENVESTQARARREVNELEKGLVILEIGAGIGPLLGLLGTISGLIKVFGQMGISSSSQQTAMMAQGIAEALNATVVGLVVAIPSLIAHSYYSRKVESHVSELEATCMDLTTKLYLVPGNKEENNAQLAHEVSK